MDTLFILKSKHKNAQLWPKMQKTRQLFNQTLVDEDESGDYTSCTTTNNNILNQASMQNKMTSLNLSDSAKNLTGVSYLDEADSESDSDECEQFGWVFRSSPKLKFSRISCIINWLTIFSLAFYQVVFDILQRDLDERIESVNLILEINCAK